MLQIEYSQSPEVYLKSVTKLINGNSSTVKHGRHIINGRLRRKLSISFRKLPRRIVTGEEYGDVDPKSEGLVRVLSYKDIRIVYKSKYNV